MWMYMYMRTYTQCTRNLHKRFAVDVRDRVQRWPPRTLGHIVCNSYEPTMPAAEFGDELVRIVEIFAGVLVPLQ